MQYWIISRKLITNVYELRLSLSPALTVLSLRWGSLEMIKGDIMSLIPTFV